MARGRGGYRKPSSPAPVSGPGAMSARTDGGAGQPVREIPGGDYGDRKATTELQQAAPMATTSGPTPPPQGGPPRGGGGPPSPIDVFGAPTSNPGEPLTEGLPIGPGGGPPVNRLPEDPDEIIRAMYSVTHHPDLLELLDDGMP